VFALQGQHGPQQPVDFHSWGRRVAGDVVVVAPQRGCVFAVRAGPRVERTFAGLAAAWRRALGNSVAVLDVAFLLRGGFGPAWGDL